MQAILLQAVEDNAVGQSELQLLRYVAASQDADVRGNMQVLHVVDQRTLPGEDASFPWVRRCLIHCKMKQELDLLWHLQTPWARRTKVGCCTGAVKCSVALNCSRGSQSVFILSRNSEL